MYGLHKNDSCIYRRQRAQEPLNQGAGIKTLCQEVNVQGGLGKQLKV